MFIFKILTMRLRSVFILIFAILLVFQKSFSQHEIQELLELFYEETGKTHTIDEIEIFSKQPIELTKENVNRLVEILGVSSKTASRIVSLNKRNLTLDEICDSLNLLVSQCELLKLCAKPSNQIFEGNLKKNGPSITLKSRIYSKLEKDTNFAGDNIDSYQGLVANYHDFSFGMSISKDIGEKSYFDNQKYYGCFNNESYKIILGRFTCKSFWGNVLGGIYGLKKGSNPVAISYSNSSNLRPLISSVEYGTLNGIAFSSNFRINENIHLSFNSFFSNINRSATYDTITGKVTSVYTMDYFRFPNELRKKNVLNEKSYYFQFIASIFNTTIGYSPFYLKFDKPMETTSKKFIEGVDNFYHSIFIEQKFTDKVSLSSEISVDKSKEIGIVGGLKLVSNKFATALNFRFFSPNFRSPFGSMLGENSYPNNEFGFFYSLETSIGRNKFQFYSDYFKSLSPISFLQVPHYGNEQFIQFLAKPSANVNIRAKIKREEKTDYIYNIQKTYQIPFQSVNYNLLLEKSFSPLTKLYSKARLDLVFIDNKNNKPSEFGFHSSFQLEYHLFEAQEIGARIHYFSTTNYNSAIYFFDIVAPEYMFTVPFYGNGVKFSIWFGLRISKVLNLNLRYNFEPKKVNKHFILGQIDLFYFF